MSAFMSTSSSSPITPYNPSLIQSLKIFKQYYFIFEKLLQYISEEKVQSVEIILNIHIS